MKVQHWLYDTLAFGFDLVFFFLFRQVHILSALYGRVHTLYIENNQHISHSRYTLIQKRSNKTN
jgi:hypothetical protein